MNDPLFVLLLKKFWLWSLAQVVATIFAFESEDPEHVHELCQIYLEGWILHLYLRYVLTSQSISIYATINLCLCINNPETLPTS